MDKASIARMLGGFFIFSELPAEQIAKIAEHSHLQQVSRAHTLFNRGDAARGLYILVIGQLKLGITSPQGGEKIISIVTPGQSFGEAVMFLDRQLPVFAEATLESQVLVVPKHEIFALLDSDPTVARKMLAGLSVRMHQLVQDIEMLSLHSSTQRFIGYLLQISANGPKAGKVTLPARRNTIASLLNLTPETLSRTVAKLEQAGLIEANGKEFVITDVARLRSFEMGL